MESSPTVVASSASTSTTSGNTSTSDDPSLLVLKDVDRFLSSSDSNDGEDYNNQSDILFDKSAMAMPVAAIKALLGVVQRSKANTMMGLQDDLTKASELMISSSSSSARSKVFLARTHFGLTSGCELFLKYVTRTFLELSNFEECRQAILTRGERFAGISLMAREKIAAISSDFIQEGQTILIHGWSRVVAGILIHAQEDLNKNFNIVVLEGRPDASGIKAAQFYNSKKIPTTIALDSAMGYIMENIDIVLVGAEGVVENGGIVNQMGTYALALCAQANNKPFYAAVESYKFTRLYPLSQRDIPTVASIPVEFYDTSTSNKGANEDSSAQNTPRKIELSDQIEIVNPPCDYTPAKFITLLFTDLGVLTPSAVSDELIRLYQ